MIERFVQAQKDCYDQALREIKEGRKRTHWMWFIFPQISGLGLSTTSTFYSIKDIVEARMYLSHPILGARLREICETLLELDSNDAHSIFGSPDDIKLRSSMTLFDVVEPNSIFAKVLTKFFQGRRDKRTLKILEEQSNPTDYRITEYIYETIEQSVDNRTLVLIGAICGDIIGSWYETHPTQSMDFKLFTEQSRFTDDTVCSIAIADALINGNDFAGKLWDWCAKYPRARYGGNFNWWIRQDPQPYNSYGDGSAMRVSAVGAFVYTIEGVMVFAKKSAVACNDHPEGIKGAQATALAIFLAVNGNSKDEIKNQIEERFGYNLDRKYSDIHQNHSFDIGCQGLVPEAIMAFLESSDYESAIRMAVAYGGDSDVHVAITGGIAAAYYGKIPDYILSECLGRLPLDIKEVIAKFNRELILR